MKRILMIFVVCCMVLPNPVHADMIIDTGEPPDVDGGTVLDVSQWLAGEFTLTEAYTITDVLGWMNYDTPGDVTVVIYGDGGDVPDGSELYSYTSDLSLVLPSDRHNAWAGAQGVSWNLGPGTYWAAFEVSEIEPEYAMPTPAPSPLDNYAFTMDSTWHNEHTDFGIRIYGVPVVPVPAAFILGIIGLGSAGLGLRRRSVKQVS